MLTRRLQRCAVSAVRGAGAAAASCGWAEAVGSWASWADIGLSCGIAPAESRGSGPLRTLENAPEATPHLPVAPVALRRSWHRCRIAPAGCPGFKGPVPQPVSMSEVDCKGGIPTMSTDV